MADGTEGPDVIVVGADDDTSIDAKGGDDLILRGYHPDEGDFDSQNPTWTIDGGSGTDTLEWVDTGQGYEQVSLVLDARTGRLPTVEFTGIEQVRLFSGRGYDFLHGLDGDDYLNGGKRKDEMRGGLGDDTYVVDHDDDVVVEGFDEGIDTVRAGMHYRLGDNFENLILFGQATNGHGNALDNMITGTSQDNVLEGLDGDDFLDGRGGADTMHGGRGDDVYVVQSTGDRVREISGALGGIDTVRSAVSFTLGEFTENLVLLDGAANATGNELANDLTGNAVANLIDGRAGADTMRGMGGDDIYVVDDVGDEVIEVSGGGRDGVHASVSYGLGAFVEKLTLTGGAAVDGTGNSGHNILTGNSAANTLTGRAGNDSIRGGIGDDRLFGGTGNDTLRGEAGTDRFYFDTALNASTNVDNLVYFTPADDWILLDRGIFSGIASRGVLDPSAFRLGTTALDADDRILYDQANGRIFYDADGVGGAAAVLFATVPDGTAVTHADFFAYG